MLCPLSFKAVSLNHIDMEKASCQSDIHPVSSSELGCLIRSVVRRYETYLPVLVTALKPTLATAPMVSFSLVSNSNEVVRKRLDGLCRVAGLLGLSVVADEDGLFCFGDAETVPSLLIPSQLSILSFACKPADCH